MSWRKGVRNKINKKKSSQWMTNYNKKIITNNKQLELEEKANKLP